MKAKLFGLLSITSMVLAILSCAHHDSTGVIRIDRVAMNGKFELKFHGDNFPFGEAWVMERRTTTTEDGELLSNSTGHYNLGPDEHGRVRMALSWPQGAFPETDNHRWKRVIRLSRKSKAVPIFHRYDQERHEELELTLSVGTWNELFDEKRPNQAAHTDR